MAQKRLDAPSLAQHFKAPDEYTGAFGWLCGYSADAAFLNDAVEEFTRQTVGQRAHTGSIHLAILLDPGNPPISLLEAPGVAHLPMKDADAKPFLLLHAKVALLGFRHQEDPSRWKVALIVSTGNWTRQTLEESIDLAWRIEVSSEEREHAGSELQQCWADIGAARNFVTWLRGFFDLRLLEKADEVRGALKDLDCWLARAAKSAGQARPRFFDNRVESLLEQLPGQVTAHCGGTARNNLALGSGFYESATAQTAAPSLPTRIADRLKRERLLTAAPDLDLFVNPAACQGIAGSVAALNDLGFTVRPAVCPEVVYGEQSRRTLHAKFLFSANQRSNSDWCNNPWVYLGSGNLTVQGFANPMSPQSGNLEAGVVFHPGELVWSHERGRDLASVVTNLLPIDWEEELSPGDVTLQAGAGWPERETDFLAAPVAWLSWEGETDSGGKLVPPGETVGLDVLSPGGAPCICETGAFSWPGDRPRVVTVRWQSEGGQTRQGVVPVFDPFGRCAATALPRLDVDAAWWQLAGFPMPPEPDESDNDLGPQEEPEPGRQSGFRAVRADMADYPIRRMMELLENIAAKQTELSEADWQLWCCRLEQTLHQMRGCTVVDYFRQVVRLNPVSPLYQPAFRPAFAETGDSEPGERYERALQAVTEAWEVEGLPAIGGQHEG